MTPEMYRPFFCLWRGLGYKVIDCLGAEGIPVPLCWVLDSSVGCIRNPPSITNECSSQANLASQSWLTHQWIVKNIAEGHSIVWSQRCLICLQCVRSSTAKLAALTSVAPQCSASLAHTAWGHPRGRWKTGVSELCPSLGISGFKSPSRC